MRLVVSKTGRRWRCIQSIVLAKRVMAEREAFGRMTSAINKAEMEEKTRKSPNPERFAGIYPAIPSSGQACRQKKSRSAILHQAK